MSAGLKVQRVIVAVLAAAVVGGALAAHFVAASRVERDRAIRLNAVRTQIDTTLNTRAYYLEDVADMVGVHDDADVREFQRYSRVRSLDGDGDQATVIAEQWVRRSPTGSLSPAGDVPPHTDLAEPMLIAPALRANAALADAQARP